MKCRETLKLVALSMALLVLLAAPASASGSSWGYEAWLSSATSVKPEPSGDWHVNIGLGSGFAPDYLGSSDYESTFLPLVDIDWRGAYFLSTKRGAGVSVYRKGNLRFGPRLTYDRGRNSDVNPLLNGLADIDGSIEAGLFVENFSGPWRFTADVRQGITKGHKGALANIGAAFGGRFSERASLIFGGGLTWMSADYAVAYFGVPADKTATLRPQFTSDSGLRDFDGYANLIFNFNQHVYVTLDGRVNFMLGGAGESPLTGRAAQVFVGTIVGFRF